MSPILALFAAFFALAIRAERRFNDSVALHRGPLLLALQVGEQWRQTGGTLPAADWEVLPTTPWAYALDLDPADPAPPFAGRLPWLARLLRRLSVLEFKSPSQPLRRPHFDRTIAYAMLAKHKYDIHDDSDVAVVLLSSQLHGDFLPSLHRDGIPLADEGPGIRRGRYGGLTCFLIDLTEIATRDPSDPVTLVSARHKTFRPDPSASDEQVAVQQIIGYLIGQKEANGMKISELDGYQEIEADLLALQKKLFAELPADFRQKVLADLPASERLAGLPASERLAGLSAEELAELRVLLTR